LLKTFNFLHRKGWTTDLACDSTRSHHSHRGTAYPPAATKGLPHCQMWQTVRHYYSLSTSTQCKKTWVYLPQTFLHYLAS